MTKRNAQSLSWICELIHTSLSAAMLKRLGKAKARGTSPNLQSNKNLL